MYQETSRWRWVLVGLFFTLLFVGLIARLAYLCVWHRDFLLGQSQSRIVRTVTIPAYRGVISDRLGVPLAVSTPLDSIWVNPMLVDTQHAGYLTMASHLGVSAAQWRRRLLSAKRQHREFMYLKRQVVPSVSDAVRKQSLPGVFIQREYKRYYPQGEVAAQLVGLTNIDDHGQEGLELSYNDWLAGLPGKKRVIKDRLGHTVTDVKLLRAPVQGKDLVLSIDRRIQYLAYQTLKAQVQRYHAESGSVVVMDAKTGEVLAMVNQPSYNPNHRPNVHDGRFRNRAMTDIFEPGSTMKPFTIALALASDRYHPETMVDTSPGRMKIAGYTIKDDGLNYGVINLQQVIQKSSNIGAAKIMLTLSPDNYWSLVQKLGFGERSSSGFPGEARGSFVARSRWYPSVVATLAYGYGIAVSTLQLAHAYQVLANEGVKVPISLLRTQGEVEGQAVMSSRVARQVIAMLASVVRKGGTGWRAHVPHYEVAGKTGTAYIAAKKGYDKHRFLASFVGLAPVDHPRLVVAVVMRDPQGQHFGGIVAAPVFSKVMGGALRMLAIPPSA